MTTSVPSSTGGCDVGFVAASVQLEIAAQKGNNATSADSLGSTEAGIIVNQPDEFLVGVGCTRREPAGATVYAMQPATGRVWVGSLANGTVAVGMGSNDAKADGRCSQGNKQHADSSVKQPQPRSASCWTGSVIAGHLGRLHTEPPRAHDQSSDACFDVTTFAKAIATVVADVANSQIASYQRRTAGGASTGTSSAPSTSSSSTSTIRVLPGDGKQKGSSKDLVLSNITAASRQLFFEVVLQDGVPSVMNGGATTTTASSESQCTVTVPLEMSPEVNKEASGASSKQGATTASYSDACCEFYAALQASYLVRSGAAATAEAFLEVESELIKEAEALLADDLHLQSMRSRCHAADEVNKIKLEKLTAELEELQPGAAEAVDVIDVSADACRYPLPRFAMDLPEGATEDTGIPMAEDRHSTNNAVTSILTMVKSKERLGVGAAATSAHAAADGTIQQPSVTTSSSSSTIRCTTDPSTKSIDTDDEEFIAMRTRHEYVRCYTTSAFSRAMNVLPDDGTRAAVMAAIGKLSDWDYDVFTVAVAMEKVNAWHVVPGLGGHRIGPLVVTAFALFVRHDFINRLGIDEATLVNWLCVVEAGYYDNPYHNATHAADVLHITNYVIEQGKLADVARLSITDILGALFAATVHDFAHPGLNNNYHITSQSFLATMYNDRSPLESMHVSSVFELMKLPEVNLFAGLSEQLRAEIRDTVVELVLATDMGLHARFVQRFSQRLDVDTHLVTRDDVRLALAMTLKIADVSNCCRPAHLYRQWSDRIAVEFFLQGDRERNQGLPITMFMDRYNSDMARGQVTFMRHVIKPMFSKFSELLPAMEFSLEFVDNNMSIWERDDAAG